MEEALIAHALSTHPCLSWTMIAAEFQRNGYSEIAAEVTRKYVKGQRLHAERSSCALIENPDVHIGK